MPSRSAPPSSRDGKGFLDNPLLDGGIQARFYVDGFVLSIQQRRLAHIHAALEYAVVHKLSERYIHALLVCCPDPECSECGEIICPFGDRLHFHHDDCPSEEVNTGLDEYVGFLWM